MNNRLKELLDKAQGSIDAMDHDANVFEKFAELILIDVISEIYRSDIGDRKQERLVVRLASKFGFTEYMDGV